MVRHLLLKIIHGVVTHSAQPTLVLGALSVCIAGCFIVGLWFVLSICRTERSSSRPVARFEYGGDRGYGSERNSKPDW
jgi:hypothetical protein